MIPYETLLNEIEKQLTIAKQQSNEQQLREQLVAIRALCDVGLSTEQNDKRVTVLKNTKSIEEKPIIYKNVSSSPLKEEDANGTSIFDF